MIGCGLLCDISEALSIAKGNTDSFGGISIIFAGDFCQLPPVGQTRLYARLTSPGTTRPKQKVMFGKLLWLSFKTVVLLTEIKRQSGPENARFLALLGRLREGRVDWTLDDWRTAPVIVSDNATKDALNVKGAISFSRRTGRPLHWYHASD
ncbi:hypothetical protein C8R45DRAFT_755374, partial [Mycena sanguinolenta]